MVCEECAYEIPAGYALRINGVTSCQRCQAGPWDVELEEADCDPAWRLFNVLAAIEAFAGPVSR